MSGRRLRKWVGVGIVLAMAGVSATAKVVPKAPVVVTISMHNDAGVPWGTIRDAEEEASRVFRGAGIEVEWVNCQAGSEEAMDAGKSRSCGEAIFPDHLQLRIEKRSVGLSPDVMGISFLSEDGSGSQADLFYEGIEGLRLKSEASLASILGHVASHEIGHLLLGTNSHAAHGIMRAVWGKDELINVSRRALFFSEKECAKMRARLGSVEAHRNDGLRASSALSVSTLCSVQEAKRRKLGPRWSLHIKALTSTGSNRGNFSQADLTILIRGSRLDYSLNSNNTECDEIREAKR